MARLYSAGDFIRSARDMQDLPTDAFAAAEFLVRHMYRPIEPAAGDPLCAVAETENPTDGDVWFWSDDNAKALEFLLRPELWPRFRRESLEILRFLQSMCRGPFIFRRMSLPRLDLVEPAGASPQYRHSLIDLRYDPSSRAVVAGIRFHDDRHGDNLVLTGNHVEFRYRRRRFRLPVETAIGRVDIARDGNLAVLRYAADLRFTANWRERPLGRIAYAYSLDPGSALVGVSATLDLAPGVQVFDVVLTIAHDGLDRFFYAEVAADTAGAVSGTRSFAAGKPGSRRLDLGGCGYYQIRQGHISADALAVHSIPSEPGRLAGIDTFVRQPGRLDRVIARYAFPGPHEGARLVAAEHKMLTAGGFYERTADYAMLMREAAAEGSSMVGARDLSISYDYGAVINGFAQFFSAATGGRTTGIGPDLADETRSLFDRYLDCYCGGWVKEHKQKRNAIFSRELAFVVLGVAKMYGAAKSESYLHRLRELCDVLLDFERRFEDDAGTPASGFGFRIDSEPVAPVDCHSAALLALAEAAALTGDSRLISAIERGLSAYCLETTAVALGSPRKIDTVSTLVIDREGQRRTENCFWNYKAGLTLRLFGVLRNSASPAVRAVAARHRRRLDLFEFVLRKQLERSMTHREGAIEFRCSVHSAETNSETQPWVMLGLLDAAPDMVRQTDPAAAVANR